MDSMKNEILNFNKRNLKAAITKIIYLNGNEELCRINNANNATNSSTGETILDLKTSTECNGFIKQVDPDLTCDEIIPHLYLSGDDVATNLELLKKKSITHILNITANIGNLFENENIIYKRILIYDLPTEDIIVHFKDTFDFIDNALLFDNKLTNNNVLVHCNAGVSRSASFVIAYLMKKGMFDNFKNTYDHVKECRPKIFPNKGFIEQLKTYEKTLNGNSDRN